MKKKIVCFLLIIVILMMNSLCLYAAEEATAGYTYNISFFSWDTVYSNPRGYINACKFSGTLKSAYKAVAYRQTTEKIDIMFFDNAGEVVCASGGFMSNLKSVVTFSGIVESGYALLSSGEFDMSNYASKYRMTSDLSGRTYWKDNDFMDSDNPGYFNTNIPLFESEEDARLFIAGELTEEDAVNYASDLLKYVYNSPYVSVVKNVKVFEDNEKYYLSWEQGIDDMSNISSVRFTKTIIAEEYERVEGDAYPHYPHIDGEFLEPALSHKVDLTALILNIHKFYLSHGISPYRFTLDIQLFNRWDKSITEIHYSNIVHAYITVGYTVKDGLTIEVEYTETDDSGNYVPDSPYNDYGDGSGLLYDNNFTVIEGSGNIFKTITNGFGLLQTGGLLDLLSSTFAFIPSDMWSIIASGISILILVGIVKMAVK